MKRSEFDLIIDSLHGTHAPFHINVTFLFCFVSSFYVAGFGGGGWCVLLYFMGKHHPCFLIIYGYSFF